MDMQYLIWLQELRVNAGDMPEKIFNLITNASGPLAMLLMAVMFWCINKRAGKFLMLAFGFGRLVNQLLKNTFCVYRPWILDSDVHPVSSALKSASSYSFPSGHTNVATAAYGGLAYYYRKKFPLLIIPCALLILTVAFSRNFLGVHTPQDVLVAIIETFIVIVVVDKIVNRLEDERQDSLFFVVSMILGIAATAYFLMKSYPIDYLDGKVIVEPFRAERDALGNMGSFAGVLIGLELERRFINFKVNVPLSTKIVRIIIGGVLLGATYLLIMPFFKSLSWQFVGEFLRYFSANFVMAFIVPLIFTRIEKRFLRRSF